ncbi:MAG: J domain-containing protein [Cyanobacteriota bacterium]
MEDEQNPEALFNETGALVLVNREGNLEASLEFPDAEASRPHRRNRPVGIDLPGFVRRNTAQLRRSLNPPPRDQSGHADVLPSLSEPELLKALETAADHWFSLYGQAASEAVVEASMAWLAHDIWSQSDQCEGEAFTWTLAQHLIAPSAPGWQEGPPTLERVIVLAGLLEDPFSASTLSLRIPTLIRRFVQRFRRRRRGASFATLEHTMTLHGALKLLKIPLDSGQRLTLPLIREAYRDMAMNHHPDAGGSAEMMRRLNEAYQLLKELYRNKEG